jgi:hypothetical protein
MIVEIYHGGCILYGFVLRNVFGTGTETERWAIKYWCGRHAVFASLLSEAEIVLRFAAYKLHSETGAVMVGSLNDRNIGLLRIEEIWLYRYNKSQTAMIPGLWCLNSTLKVKEMYIHLFMLCLYMNCYEYSKRIKFNCYLLILFAVYALCSSVLSFTASSFLNTDQYMPCAVEFGFGFDPI